MRDDLISRTALMQSLRNNVLVDVTPNLEQAIAEQPTAYDEDRVVEQIDKIMEEPWQVIKIWSRKKYIKGQVFGTYFDTFMEYELDYLTQKELEVQKPPKYRFLNWLYK